MLLRIKFLNYGLDLFSIIPITYKLQTCTQKVNVQYIQ